MDRTSQIPVNRTRRKRLHTSLYENSMGDAPFQSEVHWTHNCSLVVDPGDGVSGPVHQICGFFFFFFRYLSAIKILAKPGSHTNNPYEVLKTDLFRNSLHIRAMV